MAFGISRSELEQWKTDVQAGKLSFLTHYWLHPLDPTIKTVTKAGCADMFKLLDWGAQYGLEAHWVDKRSEYPHFDLLGSRQIMILKEYQLYDHLARFNLLKQSNFPPN